MDLSEATNKQLMLQMQDGKETAFEVLFTRWSPRFERSARAMGLASHEAEGAAAESLWRVWLNRHLYDPTRPVSPWLNTICKNTVRTMLKPHKPKDPPVDPDDPEQAPPPDSSELFDQHSRDKDPSKMFEDQEVLKALAQCIQQLAERDQKIIALWQTGASLAEIARAMGMPKPTVQCRLRRAFARLKTLMRNRGWDLS